MEWGSTKEPRHGAGVRAGLEPDKRPIRPLFQATALKPATGAAGAPYKARPIGFLTAPSQ